MDRKLRIIFMGTPEFAVPSLKLIYEAGYDIAAVVTVPDKQAGRGQHFQASAIKIFTLNKNIPVLQPEKLKDPAFLKELASYKANLFIVVAFRMLPEAVWNMPELGTFNLHASLLPDYRGAAPINRAIMNGETETGLTTFFLQHEIDTGDIILQEKLSIGPDEDAGSLHDRMMEAGANLVLKTVKAIESNQVKTIPQPVVKIPKTAPKIFKEDCRIDWKHKNLDELHNFIRGLSPYPGAWTMLDGKMLKVYKSSKEASQSSEITGTIKSDDKTFLKVACKGGHLHLLEIQLEGRKKMSVEEFLRGFHPKGHVLG